MLFCPKIGASLPLSERFGVSLHSQNPSGSTGLENQHLHLPFQFIDPAWVRSGNGGPLPHYDWGPSSSTTTPAGQGGGVQGGSLAETPSPVAASQPTTDAFQCETCSEIFPKRHLLKYTLPILTVHCRYSHNSGSKHHKKHSGPVKCTVGRCGQVFQFRRDLDRHHRAIHREMVEELTLLYCPYQGCKFSIGGTGSSRKDNLDRHIRTQHGG